MQRRWIMVAGLALTLTLGLFGVWSRTQAQAASQFFPETGRTLDDTYGFLQFWASNEGAALLGPPVTDVVVEANTPVQYFLHGRLEARPAGVTVGSVGRDYARWRTFAPPATAAATTFSSGHTLSGPFQSFWDRHNGAVMLGEPISEPLWEAVEAGTIRVQYFERGRLEQPRLSAPQLRLGNLGALVAQAHGLLAVDQVLAPAAAEPVGVDEAAPAFAALLPPPTATPVPPTPVPPTAEPIQVVLAPTSTATRAPAVARAATRQPTAAGRAATKQPTAVAAGPTKQPTVAGRAATKQPTAVAVRPTKQPTAVAAGPTKQPTAVAVRPTKQPTAVAAGPTKQPTAVAAQPTKQPTNAPAAPSIAGKVIDVNLSKQWLYAYEDGVEVYRAPVATGKDGFETPTGTFHVYNKLPLRTMRGSANGQTWVVPNVPNVLYIVGGVALHGTYWHNLFGTGVRMSHGCVNLSLRDAAWMYAWAPLGTTVKIHY